jgi:hypothetical protein
VNRVSPKFVLFLLATAPALAQSPASVAGTVHDAAGQPQIGVLVQLLSADSTVLASVFSDQDGHYTLRAVALPADAASFQVRATAAMYLPVVRTNVPLTLGSSTLVDLTLNTLTEALQWLPAQPRDAQSPDDWKWTLRSPANRPILREFDPTIILATSTRETGHPSPHDLVARASVMNTSSSFGNSGVHQILTLEPTALRQHDYFFRADIAPAVAGQSASATAATSFEEAPGQIVNMVANYQWRSDLLTGTAAGPALGNEMGSAIVRVAQTTQLGPEVQVEAGNELEQVGWGDHVLAVHPFAAVTGHLSETSTLSYTLSTTPGFAKTDDADETIERTPLAAPTAHGLVLEHGTHQEVAWSRDTGQTTVAAAYFHDSVADPVLQGIATASALESAELSAGYDSASGLLREAGESFTTEGFFVSVDHNFGGTPLGQLDACVSLTDADALTLIAGPLHGSPATHVEGAQLASVALRGSIGATRTHWHADYGAETSGVLTPLRVFDIDGTAPFLNIGLRQPLHANNLEAIVEVRNLLAQGYHPFLAPDGETIFFMQVPRSVQGGLVFSF